MTLDDYIAERLRDPEFRQQWEAAEARFQRQRARLAARIGPGGYTSTRPLPADTALPTESGVPVHKQGQAEP